MLNFVLMHSGIVNGYQLLCDAHTVLEPHSFYVFVTLTVIFLVLCAFMVCVSSLKKTADLVL